MPLISVYRDDVMRYLCDIEPDSWMCNRRDVTDAEFAEIDRLLTEQAKLQDLLKRIMERPEVEEN